MDWHMKSKDEHSDPSLVVAFNSLNNMPARDPQVAAMRRASFLSEVEQITQPVSIPRQRRLIEWKAVLTRLWAAPQKEKRPMLRFAMTVLLVVGVFLGSTSAAIAAAQNSLPESGLYPVKVWSEDTRLHWAGSDQARLGLVLQFTARRMEEIRSMLQAGEAAPEAVLARMQNQCENALRLAANQPDNQASMALLRVRTQLQLHLQAMNQLRLGANAEPALLQVQERVRTMLMEQIGLAEQGVTDPQWLRERMRTRGQNQEQNQDCQLTDCQQYQFQYRYGFATETETIAADSLYATDSNPWTTGTPTPDSSYGRGESQNPWTDNTPTPGSGYGPGESQNPWTDNTPTPGSGYGPGPGPDYTCTPQPGNGPGPQPSPSLPGAGGG